MLEAARELVNLKAREFMRQQTLSQECLAAQWILQNPDKNIADYTFVFRRTYDKGCFEFSIEAKEKY